MANTSKVSFGLGQLENQTPVFANWIFRIWFILSKALIGWIAATTLFSHSVQYEMTVTITLLLDPLFFGISKLFGIVPDQVNENLPLVADKQITPEGDVKAVVPQVIPAQEVATPAPVPVVSAPQPPAPAPYVNPIVPVPIPPVNEQ